MEKETSIRDLEALNEQQKVLKRRIEEVEGKLHLEEKRNRALEGEVKDFREQKENAQVCDVL